MRYLYLKLFFNKQIFAHKNVTILGIKNIDVCGALYLGVRYVGFIHEKDRTLLNIKGKLNIDGSYSIARGCRIDIGEGATVSIGKGGYMNANTLIVIMHRLSIGDNCAISWDCQFLDEDFHIINYEGKAHATNEIVIGNNVWIGCGVKIYKGTVIPNGCIIAANSIVKGRFTEENTLIGGVPAKIIKRNVTWE